VTQAEVDYCRRRTVDLFVDAIAGNGYPGNDQVCECFGFNYAQDEPYDNRSQRHNIHSLVAQVWFALVKHHRKVTFDALNVEAYDDDHDNELPISEEVRQSLLRAGALRDELHAALASRSLPAWFETTVRRAYEEQADAVRGVAMEPGFFPGSMMYSNGGQRCVYLREMVEGTSHLPLETPVASFAPRVDEVVWDVRYHAAIAQGR
jgi:hypothetical protein